MNIRINVKNESVESFLKSRMIQYIDGQRYVGEEKSIYNVLQDEIYFKKSDDLTIGDMVKIELFDRSAGAKKELVNIYVYLVEAYDDVSFKLVLKNFDIDLRPQN